MKKVVLTIISIVFLLVMSACGNNTKISETEVEPSRVNSKQETLSYARTGMEVMQNITKAKTLQLKTIEAYFINSTIDVSKANENISLINESYALSLEFLNNVKVPVTEDQKVNRNLESIRDNLKAIIENEKIDSEHVQKGLTTNNIHLLKYYADSGLEKQTSDLMQEVLRSYEYIVETGILE